MDVAGEQTTTADFVENGSDGRHVSVRAPQISVLLPVHNGGAYLEAAVRSVLDQTFGDFELLAIDDGSSDNSLAILKRLALEDPRIKVIARDRRGLAAALNEGMKLARGAYIARMDSDDIALPERFKRQIEFLEAHPDVVAVGTRVLLIDPDGWPMGTFAKETDHTSIDTAHMEGRGGTIVHPSAMLRTGALRNVGGYDDSYRHSEDLDLFLRLAEIGRLANLPDTLVHYRLHLGAVGYRHRDAQRKSASAAVAAARDRRGLPPKPVEAKSSPVTSIAEVHRRWAWRAQVGGYLKTTRKHALRAFRQNPLDRKNFKLLLVVGRDMLRGR